MRASLAKGCYFEAPLPLMDLSMADSFDKILTDPPSGLPCRLGATNKLLAAGMATRFVKGTSGNPAGRPKRKHPPCLAKELANSFVQFSHNAECADGRRSCHPRALIFIGMTSDERFKLNSILISRLH